MKQATRIPAPRPKLGSQLSPSLPSPGSLRNGSAGHKTVVDVHFSAQLEPGPILQSPKGARTPIGSKSPIGSPRSLKPKSISPKSPSHSLKLNGSNSPSSKVRHENSPRESSVDSPGSSRQHFPESRQNGADSPSQGSDVAENGTSLADEARSDRRYDSFVMTGDMIIRTTPKKAGSVERSASPESPGCSESSSPEKYDENSNQHCYNGPEENKPKSHMVTSKSAEKVQYAPMSKNLMSCYTSKSQENYLENAQNYVVDIDIDDKIATSFDALMLEQSTSSIDRLIAESKRSDFYRLEGTRVQEESSTDVCPNCRAEIFDTVCECVDDSRPPPLPAERPRTDFAVESTSSGSTSYDREYQYSLHPVHPVHHALRLHPDRNEQDDDGSETGSIYHQPMKDIDRPSAIRLAKRLYHLEGFRKSDVSRHLSKKNEFSQLVGEEYLKYFDFTGDTLDKALRKFLSRFSLTGETQERERILNHFSHRYMECNPNTYNSDDACHTLTCAIMLLNTDLHGQNIGRKMTSSEFVENLSDLNDGEDFPPDILRQLYTAIKTDPLVWALDEEEPQNGHCPSAYITDNGVISAQNPFLMIPDPTKTTEYISGYVMRKCCIDQDGRRTPIGKRSWKMFYATLKDMILYLHKDQNSFHKHSVYHMNNAIRIHHALAVRAVDYTKKHHVFRLKTADWAEYLFQTSDSKELQRWIDTINYVAASLSAPPLPGAVGSQRKFQRPLMPSSYTRLNLQQQLLQHESRLDEMERDLKDHRSYPPEKGAKPRLIQDYLEKENYLEYELKRFNTYVYLLQARLHAFPPATDPETPLVEHVIGEVEEPHSPPTAPQNDVQRRPISDKHSRHVQRSLSDRYSYRAAIYDVRPSAELL